MKLINYYLNKSQQIVIKFLDDNENKQYNKIDYQAYFWILKKDLDKTDEVLKDLVVEDFFSKQTSKITFTKGIEEGEWLKIYYNPINEVYLKSIIREIIKVLDINDIKHFELDLFPSDLWMLDNPNIEIADKYDILFFDIETDDRKGGVIVGRDRILSICGIDDKGNKFEFCDDDEKIILEKFIKLLDDYDIIIGWNSNKFDVPYIKARLLKNKIYFSFKSIIHIDLMKVFMSSFAISHTLGTRYIESYALDFIAREYLQDQKLEIGDGEGYGGRIWRMFENDREKLLKYNMQDCVLLKKLNEKYHLIDNELEISKYVGFPLSTTRSASAIVDKLLLRECRKRKIHWKTAQDVKDKPHQEGGAVLEPIPGLHENVNIYDFNSLYPNIFRTFNISPDTIIDKKEDDCIVLPNKCMYTNKFIGFVPEVLDKMTTLRLKYKAELIKFKKEGKKEEANLMSFRETALKVIILSTYGIMGAPFSRFFNIDVANSITTQGQYLLKTIAKELDANGYLVVGGDTDSVFFKIDNEDDREEVEKIMKETIDRIVKETNTHRQNTLKISHEKTLKKFLVLNKGSGGEGAKKKYAGRCIVNDGKECDELYFRGIELHKSSELKITKQFLEEILKYILWEDSLEIKKLEELILKYKKRIVNKDVEADEITIVKRVGKMPEDYKNLPIHVAIAIEKSKEGGYFYVGQKVAHIILSNKPLKAIHKREFAGEFDTEYYWRSQVFPPTYRVLNTIFSNYNWMKYDTGDMQHQTSIDDFMK